LKLHFYRKVGVDIFALALSCLEATICWSKLNTVPLFYCVSLC